MLASQRVDARKWRDLTKYAKGQGLTSKTAEAYATLTWWGMHYGLDPAPIVSGYRSARRQRELVAAWDRGQRAGLAVRPAVDSAHTQGKAFDLARVPHLWAYGQLSSYLPDVRWGGTFRTPDPIHFDLGG